MKIRGLVFRKILKLGPVEEDSERGQIIKFELLDEEFARKKRGVYLITINKKVVYCGKYTRSFIKRWLYFRHKYIYHFKKVELAKEIEKENNVSVYAETEDNLKKQLALKTEWVDVNSIEANIIRTEQPDWNKSGS